MDKNINTGRALSVGGEDVRPSRDVQSLLIPESTAFRCGGVCQLVKLIKDNREIAKELPYYKAFENWTGDSASSLIQYFDYTIECRAKLHYFCTYGKELED